MHYVEYLDYLIFSAIWPQSAGWPRRSPTMQLQIICKKVMLGDILILCPGSMAILSQHDSTTANGGWRRVRTNQSLSEVFGTIATRPKGSMGRKLLAFLGPGYLVAVGYMDPGNWATSL